MTTEAVTLSSTKYCYKETCKKPLVRRKGEPKSHFEKRMHCNLECSRTNPLLHKAQADSYAEVRETETKVCPECKKTFSRTRNESRAVFEVKECCTRACADEKMRKEREKPFQIPKTCEVCDATFYRRRKTESKQQFEKRRTCSNECGHALRSSDWAKKSPNGKKKASEYELKLKQERENKKTGYIPPSPQPQPTEVWRPASWGGPRKLEAS
jgi:hypothetical protein